MKLKDYSLKETTDVKMLTKVFCRRYGEHLGYLLFKLPFKIKHHNSLIKGDASNVVVLLKSGKLLIIEEYQVDHIKDAKKREKRYLKNYSLLSILDDVQYKAHLSNLKRCREVLKF